MSTRHIRLDLTRSPASLVMLANLFFFYSSYAGAATYYVAPNGSNSNTGTQAAPFATLQKAHDVAVAGDTIYMRGGTYNWPTQTTITRDGTPGNRIKVWNFPNEVPVINASGQAGDKWPIRMNGGNWWHIKGLEIKNGGDGGIVLTNSNEPSSNNIIEQCHVHHNGVPSISGSGKGIAVYNGSANNLILNNDVHHETNPNRGNEDADGIIVFSLATGNVVRGNRVWNNADDGIDLWNSPSVLVENNWVWNNGKTDAGGPTGGDGNGLKLGGAGTGDGGHIIRQNVVWNNAGRGFDQNSADRPITLYNNTAWNNAKGNFGFWNQANIYRNNIAFGSLGSISGSDTFNSWTLGVTVSAADFSSLDDTIARGPRNANGSLPTSNFLRLVAGSDLIDRGVNVGIPYSGSAPDLGAFEYGGSVPPSPSPSQSPPPPPPPPSSSCPQTTLIVSSAASDGGFSYIVVKAFGTPADNNNNPTGSTLRLFENDVEVGPAHVLHVDIRNLGAGRFSHWSSTNGTGRRFGYPPPTTPIRGRMGRVTHIVCLRNRCGNG